VTQLPATRPASPFPMPIGSEEGLIYPDGAWPDATSESVIRKYWRILYKNRWVMVAAVGFCLALALIVSMLTQREYSAATRIQVAREAPKVVDMEQVDDEQSGTTSIEFYQTQYALLKSRSLSEAVVRDLGLENDYLYLANYQKSKTDDIAALPVSQRMELATTMVNRNTVITPVRGSSIIDVEFSAPNPALTARAANSIAENFIESNLARRFEAAAYAREFLQNRLNQIRGKLEDSERKAVAYAQQQGLINIKTGSADNPTEQSLIASQLSELSTQLTAARAARSAAEAQYRSGNSGSVAAESLTSTTVNELHSQRAELLGQLSKLQSDFGPQYPPVVALRSQIAEIDKQIAAEQSRVSSSVNQDLAGKFQQALATERDLQAKVDGLKTELLGEQSRSIQFNILQRDVDTNRALYEALLQRFKEVGIAGGVGTNNVSIVDRALEPRSPSSPNIPLNLTLGLLLGLIIGGVAALVLEQLAESVILPAEFQRKLRIPLLGSTPASRTSATATKLLPSKFLPSNLLPSRSPKTADVGKDLSNRQSELSEAYFSVLTAVQFSTANGAPRTIAITSSQAQEGKSTSALALARGLASLGSRVLLVDSDLRNPSLHRSFGTDHGKGLSDVLTGHAVLAEVVRETGVRGLSIVTSGKIPPNPAELLAGEGLTRMMKAASESFDHVLFDSPPVLGLADAPLIARACEGTVFVIEAGRTRSSQARHALDRLMSVRAHILGAVLTKLDSKNSGYGYGYGYTYRYGTT
jgi:polysaccharide biosynthesis transport protein